MATRINTKFVITLVSVIILMVLGLVLAFTSLKKNAQDHIKLAQAAMARATDAEAKGDIVLANSEYKRAAQHFGSAKTKDQSNTESLYGFIEAHEHILCNSLTTAGNELDTILNGAVSLHDTPGSSDDDRKVLYEILHNHTRMVLSANGQNPVGAIIAYTKKRLDVAPDDPVAQRYQALALGYLGQQRTKETEVAEDIEKIAAAINANPQDPWLQSAMARYHLGNARRLYSAKGNTFTSEVGASFALAFEHANAALALAQDNPPAYLDAALILADVRVGTDKELLDKVTQHRMKSHKALETMLTSRPNRDKLYIEELANAIVLIQRVNIKPEGDTGEGYNGLSKALALAEQYTTDRPEEPSAYRVFGNLQEQVNQVDEAIGTFEKGLAVERQTNARNYIRDHMARLDMTSSLANLKCTMALRQSDATDRDALLKESSTLTEKLADLDTLNPDQAVLRDARVNHMRGRVALVQDKVQLAVKMLDEANKVYKNKNVETLRLLAQAHARLRNDALVTGYYETIVASGRPTIEDLLNLINLYLNPGENQKIDRAEALLTNYQQQLPNDVNGIRMRARLMQVKGEVNEAIAMLQEQLEKHPSLIDLISALQASLGDSSGIIKIYRERLANTPEGEEMSIQIVAELLNLLPEKEQKQAELKALVEQGLEPKFAAVLERMLASGKATLQDELDMIDLLQKDPAQNALQKFLAHRKWGEAESGQKYFDEAIKTAPKNPTVIEWRYKIALEEKQWDNARKAIKDMLALPESERSALAIADGRFMNAQVLAVEAGSMEAGEARDKKIRDAIVAYNNALNAYSHNIDGWIQLGRLHLSQENYFAAQDSLQEALNRQSNNPVAMELLALSQGASGDRIVALENYEQVLQLQPNNATALNQFTALALEMGLSSRAIQLRESIAKRVPGNYDNRRALAILYGRTNDHEKAKLTIQAVIDEEGKTIQNVAVLCEVFNASNESEKAVQVATEYLSTQGDKATWRDHLLMASIYEQTKQTVQADASFAKAIELEKAEGTLLSASSKGQALINRGQVAEAAKMYEGMIDQYPDNDQLKLRTAELYLGLQGFEKAEAIAQSMGASAQRDRLMVQSASMQQGKLGVAIERARKAVAAYPSDFGLRLNLVELLRVQQDMQAQDKRDYTMVLAQAKALLKDHPDRVEAMIALSDVLLQMDRGKQAETELERALVFAPRHIGVNERLARIKITQASQLAVTDRDTSQEQARQALAILSMLIEARPDAAGLLRTAGQAAEIGGLPAQAVDYYRRAYEADKTDESLSTYATALLSANQGANARAVLEDPANATLVVNSLYLRALRGRAIAAAGQPDVATNVFRTLMNETKELSAQIIIARQVALAFATEPKRAVTLMDTTLGENMPVQIDALLADMLLARKEYEVARERLIKYWSDPAQDVSIQHSLLTQLALAQQESGQLSQAKATYDKVYGMLEKNKDLVTRNQRVQFLNNMAYLLADQLPGYQNDAVRYAKQAVDLMSDQDPPMQFALIEDTLGWAHHKAGNDEEAIKVLKASVKRYPLVANQMHLGQVYLAIGDKDKALLVLRDTMNLARSEGDEKLFAEAKKYFDQAK